MADNNTLLVVDDESAILETYQDYLTPKDTVTIKSSRQRDTVESSVSAPSPTYRLLLADTGEKAIEVVRQEFAHGRRIAGGFFDMKMPGGIDGIETLRRIRELDPDLLCTVVTAFQERSIDDINALFRHGAEDQWDYLNKPFTKAEIQQKARSLVSSWNRRRREETQRDRLERLIRHLSTLKALQPPSLRYLLQAILTELAAFCHCQDGLIATLDPTLRTSVALGDFLRDTRVDELLCDAGLHSEVEQAVQRSAVLQYGTYLIVPLPCGNGPRLAAILPTTTDDEAMRFLQIFANNAGYGLDTHLLFHQLKQMKETLEERAVARTDELRQTTEALQSKAIELERTVDTLKRTEGQLIQKGKLAVIGQLAASVAHEVNNPATYILSNLEMTHSHLTQFGELSRLLAGDADLTAIKQWAASHGFETKRQEMLTLATEATEGVERIASIVNELRVFGRTEREERQPVDVITVIERALRILRNQIRHRCNLTTDFHTVSPVTGNAGRLLQVFTNLILNASQAGDPTKPGMNQVIVACQEVGDRVEVSVADTGTGIPVEDLDRIFEPFFTTKKPHEGTGLGLSVCKAIVEQHQGTLAVQSVVNRGSRFVVSLPIDVEAAHAETPLRHAPHSPKSIASLRVLLVDDDRHVLDFVGRALATQCTVETAQGGSHAIKILSHDTAFDAIICDVMMPEMSGPSFFEHCAQAFPGLTERFIFITAGAFAEPERQFLASYQGAVLEKPFRLSELVGEIARLKEDRDRLV